MLDFLQTIPCAIREYYGDDKSKKPNDHCYWDGGNLSRHLGWYENDEHFKLRIIASMSDSE